MTIKRYATRKSPCRILFHAQLTWYPLRSFVCAHSVILMHFYPNAVNHTSLRASSIFYFIKVATFALILLLTSKNKFAYIPVFANCFRSVHKTELITFLLPLYLTYSSCWNFKNLFMSKKYNLIHNYVNLSVLGKIFTHKNKAISYASI